MTHLETIPIVPGLSLLPGQNGGRFPFSHSVLAEDGGGPVLVDAGCGLDTLRALRDQSPPALVIASHGHVDHAAGCFVFPGARLAAPLQAADTFGRLGLLAGRFMDDTSLRPAWTAFVRKATGFDDATPTELYGDGQVFRVGRLQFVAIPTPGHTVDHMCLWEPDHRVLLAFDIDLTSFGPWYGHRESDIDAFKRSIRLVMNLRPRILVSSHKGVITEDAQAGLQRFLDVFDERDRRILGLLHHPRTLADLADEAPIYGRFPYAEQVLRHWEQGMIAKHLAGLEREGQVVRAGDLYVRRG